jgi:uncharacterized protein (TIGR01777 family)
LRAAGHEVFRLVRGREVVGADEIAWDPSAGVIDVAALDGANAFINLAGENVGAGRWTTVRRERILRSRVDATRTLVAAMGRMPMRPQVFLNASAIGFYGDRGDEVLTEKSGIGRGFLAEVCLAWETHAEVATRIGVRTGLLRFGVILSREGGALAKMLPVFRLGLGGRIGGGQQWMSWISIDDVAAIIVHALADARCAGPMNVVAPAAVTNTEFATVLGRALNRPAVVPVPAFLLRMLVGEMMADEALLASARAAPKRLSEIGYRFKHPTIDTALEAVLKT